MNTNFELHEDDVRPLLDRMFKQFGVAALFGGFSIEKIISTHDMFGYTISVEMKRSPASALAQHTRFLLDALTLNEDHRPWFIAPLQVRGLKFHVGDGDDSGAAAIESGKLRFWLRAWPDEEPRDAK